MDFKKVLDQTVREIKREVNKKVLKVPEIEQKVLDATSNEPWGPHGTAMAEIAQATRNHFEYQMIMTIIWKRLSDSGRNWRHVYKALTLMEYLVAHGSERVIDDIREHGYQISALSDFQYLEPNGKDQGINVRKKSQAIMSLVNDKEKIREARQKAVENRDKYRGVSSTGGIYKPSTYQSSGGGYGDRYREDGYGGAGRYGGRDDYGYKDGDQYRDDDKEKDWEKDQNGKEGDHYRDDYKKGYDREEDRHDAKRDIQRNEKYDRAYDDEEDRHSRRSIGGQDSGFQQDERTARPPSYEEAHRSPEHAVTNNGDQSMLSTRAWKSSTDQLFEDLSSTKKSFFDDDDDDEFNPRAGTAVFAQNDNVFNKPAPVSAVKPLAPPPASSISVGNNSAFGVPSAQVAANSTFLQPSYGDVFEGSPFKVEAPPAPSITTNPSNAFSAEFSSDNNFGTFTSSVADPHVSIQSTEIPYSTTIPSSKGAVPNNFFGSDNVDIFTAMPTVTSTQAVAMPVSDDLFGIPLNSATATSFAPTSGVPSTNIPVQEDFFSNFHVSQGQPSGFPSTTVGASAKMQQEKRFETKSTVWADGLSKGLIDLNISAPKSNPLGDLGIDFDLLRTERKKEERILTNKASSTSMGKAMGSGSGLGVAGASVLVRPGALTVNNVLMTPSMNINAMGMGTMGMSQSPMQMGLNPGMATRPVGMGPVGMGFSGLQNQQQYGGYM